MSAKWTTVLLLAGVASGADPFGALHENLGRAADESLTRSRFQVRWARPHVFQVRWAKPRPLASPYLWDVARVESGFNRFALSPKGARGMFQFMPDTARRFGLRVDGRFDERLDAAKSSVAAARYLNFLHGLFGDWKLALAAYNAGENRVLDAMKKAGSRDFFEISRRGLLPEETRQYIPKVLGGQ